MAAWIRNRKYWLRTGAVVAAWTVGTVVPNTVGMPFFDSYCSQIHSFYKDLQFDKECMEVLDETIEDINASRSYPVNKHRLGMRLTTLIPPNAFAHKGSSRLSTGIIVFPIGMRINARDAFYLHCPFPKKENLEHICLLTKAEQKFLYALSILYTEDNFFLHRTALGSVMIGATAAACLYVKHLTNEYMQKESLRLTAKFKKASSEVIEKLQYATVRRVNFFRISSFLLIPIVAANIYWEITAALSRKLERTAHQTVAKLGPIYAQSGSDYYDKCVLFNSYLRSLGYPHFTEYGEEVSQVKQMYPRQLTLKAKQQVYLDSLQQYEVTVPFASDSSLYTPANKV